MRKRCKLLRGTLLAVPFFATSFNPAAAQDATAVPVEQLHQELRDLKKVAEDAINNKQGDALLNAFTDNVILTAFNNDNVRGLDAARAYYDKMMVGADRFITEMSIAAEADDLSQLYANNTMAVVSGTSKAHFALNAGPTFDVPLRWTAVADRSSGQWKFAAMHFSADPVNNPLAGAAAAFWKWVAAGVAVAALLIGYFLGRRSRRAV